MLFVMGASGRVGGALIRALDQQAPIRCGGHAQGMTRFNVLDSGTYAAALDGVTSVFLMRPPQIATGSAFGPFLDACEARGIKRIAVLSVRGAENNPILPHHGMEQEVMRRNFDWTVLRPADFMQNLETVHRDDILTRDKIAVPAGRGASAFVDVADIGAIAAKVLMECGHAGKGYTLTGPEALSFAQVACIMTDVLKRVITYDPPSIPQFIVRRRANGTPLSMALVMTALYSVQRLGGAAQVTDEVACLLGRSAGDLRSYIFRQRALWERY